MKNIPYILFTFILSSTVVFSQNTTFQKIDQYLTDYQKKIPIPGFSIAIVTDGKVVFTKGYGVEKQGFNKAMSPNSSLGVGSLGRAITAIGIMQLVEKGQIDLDAPVTQYLPWFTTANKNFSDQITVRMCLSNTTAIPSQYEAVPSLDPNKSLAKFVRSMEGYYVKRKPGLSYEFSDEGYSIAGLIISELSGMPYADYIEKYICEPLKMTKTTTNPDRFEALNVLYGHEMALTTCIPAERGTIDGNFFPAGSEIKSSASDYANLMLLLLNDGKFEGQSFLKPESVQEIFKSNVSYQGLGTMLGGNGIDIHCGLGWLEMNIEERKIYIQAGNTGNTAAISGLSRERNQGVVLLFNGDVNRLDRYVYPTLENTANNVIHLLNNEATTDFAVMRFDDPFEDEDYVLPKEKWSKYLGKYFAFGKESPFFKDINIEIYEGDNEQIELKAFKEKVLKGHYILQFTNESRAALRNISHPREIQFKIFPNGIIGGLFMFGTEFKKRDAKLVAKFKTIKRSTTENNLSFLLPETAVSNWNDTQFSATFPTIKSTDFKLTSQAIATSSFEDYVAKMVKTETITLKGNLLSKNLRDGIWTEQSIFTKEGDQTRQHIFIFFQDPIAGKQVQAVLSNPYGSFNSEVQEILMYFQRSISF